MKCNGGDFVETHSRSILVLVVFDYIGYRLKMEFGLGFVFLCVCPFKCM